MMTPAAALAAYRDRLGEEAKAVHELPSLNPPSGEIAKRGAPTRRRRIKGGHFFGPVLAEIPSPAFLQKEVFGPILHVVRYDANDLEAAAAPLAAAGYGLTLGVHSRIEAFATQVRAAVPAGNAYVNRSMIGAVVGVQPFGGEGLSGTGPKAGGPNASPALCRGTRGQRQHRRPGRRPRAPESQSVGPPNLRLRCRKRRPSIPISHDRYTLYRNSPAAL